MSALAAHIRVLRAEADKLRAIYCANPLIGELVEAVAEAKSQAADLLEAEERALAARVEPSEGDVKFHPKGKAKR